MKQKSILFIVLFGLAALLLQANINGAAAWLGDGKQPAAGYSVHPGLNAQMAPTSSPTPDPPKASTEQKVYLGNGAWLVTNPVNGHFVRVEMGLPDPASSQPQTPAEQKVRMGGGSWLVTNPENGHIIRVEMNN